MAEDFPNSLRDFYLVAGQEKVLNHAFNRILAPDDWEIHAGKFPFMVENQCVVVWGIDVSATPAMDAAVFQGPIVKGEPRQWFEEHKQCSTFLVFMLHHRRPTAAVWHTLRQRLLQPA